eukprot:26918-Eustigmatos_ZCMA.PRE.1
MFHVQSISIAYLPSSSVVKDHSTAQLDGCPCRCMEGACVCVVRASAPNSHTRPPNRVSVR